MSILKDKFITNRTEKENINKKNKRNACAAYRTRAEYSTGYYPESL